MQTRQANLEEVFHADPKRRLPHQAARARVHTKTCSGAGAYRGCTTDVEAPRHANAARATT
jgi:hypothetical protein